MNQKINDWKLLANIFMRYEEFSRKFKEVLEGSRKLVPVLYANLVFKIEDHTFPGQFEQEKSLQG